jgi:hypothetical protein
MGKKSWLILAMAFIIGAFLVLPAGASLYHFDMNYLTSPTYDSYTPILDTTVYSVALHHGWDNSTGLSGANAVGSAIAGTPLEPLYRDFNRADATHPHTFKVDLAYGEYSVKLYFYSTSLKDNMQVLAEGNMIFSDIDLAANSPLTKTFSVAVTDGQLDLTFQKNPLDPGTSTNWIINGIDIATVPIPPTALLLGSGLLGLGLLRFGKRA